MISILDTIDAHVVDWWLVFRDLPPEATVSPFWKIIQKGFQHVECWRADRGAWVRIDPCLELIQAEVHLAPPWHVIESRFNPTFLRVTRVVPAGKVREPFFLGPITCVELTKAAIGLRAPFVRTPFQLYKYLKRKSK